MQAGAKKKRYSRAEIARKLARANNLATQGKRQSEIARALDVSVMTLHRWRKARDPIAQLQHENSLLRRLVTDLLLEKISSKPGMTSRRNVTAQKKKYGRPTDLKAALRESAKGAVSGRRHPRASR
jgi:putative transposase